MNIKKTGFTLVELLGVITVLAIIALLAAVPITKAIKDSNIKACKSQFDNIILAAKLWGDENVFDLPDTIGAQITVTVGDLKKSGYLEKDVKNPITKEQIPDNTSIKIVKEGKRYWKYTFVKDVNSEYCAE